ncbi:hypothetical protein B9Z19DRAFT_1088166 [Tuber borchii]|uniref:Uncharacterized protein n=1 Tax=Tuber borchii TaxID=42251 RepID=A0A2T6ZM03_TUBBO|nr:hypothetical protein B9Z19DRAFT_1088166 [Tuber borchii]
MPLRLDEMLKCLLVLRATPLLHFKVSVNLRSTKSSYPKISSGCRRCTVLYTTYGSANETRLKKGVR